MKEQIKALSKETLIYGASTVIGRFLNFLLVPFYVNVLDPAMMKTLAAAPWVLVAEGWNVKTGLGSRFGSYLLQAGFKGKYNHIGVNKEGCGGLWQQMGYQGLDPAGILAAIKKLIG